MNKFEQFCKKHNIHINIKNPDGTYNGVLLSSLASLGLVAIKQIFGIFGINFPIDYQSIADFITTILTIFGMLGVVSNVQHVTAPSAKQLDKKEDVSNEEKK
ncbi:hypothetical protein IV37_GL000204 [Fructilactobacillus fructivorans]|uniref:hypothetical protein n=1 Tax=Fructilactobacillus fructivorans TaxID=1614 RepID=UPI000704BADC|nr:hypothetical protein [Fructilactobacillus fructivorans]KRN13482.1 hypothetical protein IV37_GL000204 [Fructilactobacillus fructivorans]